MNKREKKWWQHLLVIPAMLLVDTLLLIAAGHADTSMAGDGLGHPVPAFLLFAMLICGVLTVVLTVRALFLCVKALVRTRKGSDTEPEYTTGDRQEQKKPVWRCYIPLMAEIPLAVIAVGICGYYEINKFYNNPAHIGFAIPAGTFLLVAVCLVIIAVTGIICTIAAAVRKKKNDKL